MKNCHLRYSLKFKTNLISISVIILSVTLCSWLLTDIVGKKLKDETVHSAQLNAQLVVQHLDEQFACMQQAYDSVLYDSQIQTYLLQPELDPLYQDIRKKMDTILMGSNYHVSSIYIKNFFNDRIYTTDFLTWQDSGGYGGNAQAGAFIAPELIVQKSFPCTSAPSCRFISLVGQIHQERFGEPLGWLSINTQINVFSTILGDDSSYEDAPLLLADQSGNVIVTGEVAFPTELVDSTVAASTGDTLDYGGERYLVIAAETDNFHWQYRKLLPESQILSDIYYLRRVLFIIFLLFSAVVFLGLYQVLNYITNPIYELSNQVRSYLQSENSPGSFHTNRKDEFAYLYQSLQEMTERIDHLIDGEYKAQLYKKETQLRVYRNGLNPHFLYNILDSLLWTIKFEDYSRAEQILRDFSVFLHHVLNSNKEFISVPSMREELRTFCELSSFLKDDGISWSVEFTMETLAWDIPSFLVQPLVENCFKHAFNGREKGCISITGYVEGEDLVFRIQDDGVGMTAEQRQNLISYLDAYDFNKEDGHFGLASVHQRLKLYYGDAYGLDISTEPGAGTVTMIRLPIQQLTRTEIAEKV